ncbi:MAG: hypothetical protein DMG38_20260 [Acidobacteria bacterium]|nr:MAG: hypothetical protein DMG38_20260 [Acidobacteriota bacterium]
MSGHRSRKFSHIEGKEEKTGLGRWEDLKGGFQHRGHGEHREEKAESRKKKRGKKEEKKEEKLAS